MITGLAAKHSVNIMRNEKKTHFGDIEVNYLKNMNQIKTICLILITLSIVFGIVMYSLTLWKVNPSQELTENTNEIDDRDVASSEELFERNERCASYRKEIESIIDGWSEVVPTIYYSLDEIFYSPSKHSCLFSYIEYWFVDTKLSNKFYSVMDYFTNETIVATNGEINDTSQIYWEDRKKELKDNSF